MPRKKNPEGVKSSKNLHGMGNIYRNKNGQIEFRKMKDGQRLFASSKSSAVLKEKIKEISGIQKNKIKVSEWFEKWLEDYVKKMKKPATYEQYNTLYKQHIKPVIGKYMLKNVKQHEIQKVIAEMNVKTVYHRIKNKKGEEIRKTEKPGGYSSWTMKHVRKIMHIAFESALDQKFISENPVTKIEIPKKQAKPRKTLVADEIFDLLDAMKNTRWIWAVKFLIVTGLRRGELLALKWSNIDYDNKKIIVSASNSKSGLGDTKSAKVHYPTLSNTAKKYLEEQKALLKGENNPILHDERKIPFDLIFPTKTGTMMKPESFNTVIKRYSKKAGIHASPHMFRHTYVYMSKGLLTLPELQENLGHEKSTTTLDIYGTMLTDTADMADKLDVAFAKLEQEELPSNVIPFRRAK